MVLIYKLFSKSVDSFYIGSTTKTLKYRLEKHRGKSCEAPNRKVYKYISDTGGFKEWNMELIETIDTTDDMVRRQREQFWIDELKPDLNDRSAFRIKH